MTEQQQSPTPTALSVGPGANRRTILCWAMWDWGTQPFNSVITTFVFSVYITSAPFGATNATSTALSISTAVSGFAIALLAPVLGQNSDRSGTTVRTLRLLTWALAIISASLYFVRPHPSYLWFGLILLGVGSIVSEIAGVNYNSLLDRVATPKNVGRISGFGWGMGYLGGIVVLLALYFLFIAPDVGLFGVTNAEGMDIRVSMLVCGLWTAGFTIPTFIALRDRPVVGPRPAGLGVLGSYAALGRSIAGLWRRQRQTVYFLLASALFRDGLAGVFAFGAVIAAGTFGFSAGQVVIFGAVANIVAGVSTMLFGMLDDRLGARTVILGSLGALVAIGALVFLLHDQGQGAFWVLGLLMSAFVGPAQAASRSFLARSIPAGMTGEVFGLYATTGRVVSFLSPALFGVMISVGAWVTGSDDTQYWGILGVAIVLLAGLLVMIPVKPVSSQT